MSSAAPTQDNSASALRPRVLAVIQQEIGKLAPGTVVTDETDITRDLALDSVSIMDLMFALEEEFDLSVPMHDLADVYTVGSLADLVCRLKKAAA